MPDHGKLSSPCRGRSCENDLGAARGLPVAKTIAGCDNDSVRTLLSELGITA